MEYDLATHLSPVQALAPAALTSETAGNIIDSMGFESLTFTINAGAVAAQSVLTLEHGDASDLSDAATVDADDLIGELVPLETGDANSTLWFGYIGKKRYVRITFTSGDATVGIVAVKGHPHSMPTL